MTGLAPTSFSFTHKWKYDVFINFRGEDTRYGFTGHLYNAFNKAALRTFIDDEEIQRGHEITPTLMEAIQNSRMAIVVFSPNYASSTLCLKQLVKIHDCIFMKGRLVFPIFYKVDPLDVRHQKGVYGEALDEHFKTGKADEKVIRSWKQALHEMANKSGDYFILGQRVYEHEFIEEIVKNISSKMDRVVHPLYVCDNPVGLESRVKDITYLMQIGSNDEKVIMVGICGMGGLGKSTTARALYNSVAAKFEGSCFVGDVKEKSTKFGLEKIQDIILSEIEGGKFKIHDVHSGAEEK